MELNRSGRRLTLVSLVFAACLGGAGSALLGVCGPFTDVSDAAFCPFVLEIFTLGITTGTSPTTYSPTDPVTRLQMAAFLSRSVDGVLKRGGPRAALDQFWTTQDAINLGVTTIGGTPKGIKFDGTDVWVSEPTTARVFRVRGSDAKLLETWTGAFLSGGVLSARSKIFVAGSGGGGGRLYQIDPSQPAGAVTTVASNLGDSPEGIAYDGSRIWTGNFNGTSGSVSIVTPGPAIPWATITVTSGFTTVGGILYDGANIWVTSAQAGTLLKLNAAGAILQTVTVGALPNAPVFDGANIWVPNLAGSSVSVVRASNGAVLATLTGNGLNGPGGAAFDGQRVMVTNYTGNSVSLWKAADLTPIGTLATGGGTNPFFACSDGISFWIALNGSGQLLRY